jgi:hypothetical protein
MLRTLAVLLIIAVPIGGCSQYRLASLDDVEVPNYDPRPVAIPPTCEGLIQRAAEQGMTSFSETDARELLFCQQQHIIRAQEEDAAAKRLEAHASAARFVLQMATVVVGTLVAVLAWAF